MLLEVYKCIKKVNAPCLHNLVNSNTIPYQLRTSKLEQPLHRTTRYGLRTFSYVGSHLWNFVLNDYNDIAQIDFDDFKAFLNTWKGPDILQHAIPLLWWSPILHKHFSYVFRCELDDFIQVYMYFFFYPTTVHWVTALYIFASYSRILAFWVMLFVYNATLNKALSILSYLIIRPIDIFNVSWDIVPR